MGRRGCRSLFAFATGCYRGVYCELVYKRGKKARIKAKAKAQFLISRRNAE